MTSFGVPASSTTERSPTVERLLFVADAAVAEVVELPPAVRAILESATEVSVVTPSLPGRLAWLTDDVDRCRHVADERLDAVLGHVREIGADANGLARRGSVLTVIADAVADFTPDHILLALRSSEDANWQERRLIEHVEDRFGLPVTAYAVDVRGRTASAYGPLLLCYDGSADAAHAIEHAGALFPGRHAVVVTAWQPLHGYASIAQSSGALDVPELDREAAENAGRLAAEGAHLAEQAGLTAEPLAIEAAGTVWRTILDLAERQDAAAIVMGSRGLAGLRSRLLGSVSSAVADHSARPTLIIRRSVAGG